jgi:hypothetical protein
MNALIGYPFSVMNLLHILGKFCASIPLKYILVGGLVILAIYAVISNWDAIMEAGQDFFKKYLPSAGDLVFYTEMTFFYSERVAWGYLTSGLTELFRRDTYK